MQSVCPLSWFQLFLITKLTSKENWILVNKIKLSTSENFLHPPVNSFIIIYFSYVIIAILEKLGFTKIVIKRVDRINLSSQIWVAIIIQTGSVSNSNKIKMKLKVILCPWMET